MSDGSDPGVLGDTFYSYYTSTPLGVSWQPATLNRLTITYTGDCTAAGSSANEANCFRTAGTESLRLFKTAGLNA